MKELSIEEKAKRYDKAIEKAKELYPKFKGIIARHVVEELFPELKISEDENIRRGLIQYFNNFNLDTFAGFDPKKILAWLEKLGEQKSKVEAKFKIDDWVVSPNGVYWHIDAIRDGRYQVSSDSGGSADWPLDTNIYHKFTIQDAKDGDVLHSPSHHLIWIYKDNEHYYACVNMNYVTKDIATNGLIIIPNDACPATKDEQTILFARMKEADYEWNAEKKELKEIEQ